MKLLDFFSDYMAIHRELRAAVESLTQAQLDWNPGHGHPATIGKLLVHIADCECFWIDCVVRRTDPLPDFSRFHNAATREEMLSLHDEQHAGFKRFLETEEIEDWDDVFYTWEDKGVRERFSKRWLTWHVVEHLARHRGQIFMLMRMQGLEVPNV